MTDQLNQLLDEREIARRLVDYCHAMDQCDVELGYSVFHPEAVADHGEIYQGTGRGFVDMVAATRKDSERYLHRISNIAIDVDGDEATSESYVDAIVWLTQDDTPFEMNVRGRYLDRWQRWEGRWVISARRYVQDTDSLRPR